MKFKYVKYLAAALLTVGFTACSDNDDYTPGPESDGFYFDNAQPQEYLDLTPDDNSFSFVVSRANAEGTATAQLIVDADPVFNIPTSVSFAAGQKNVSVPVTFDGSALDLVDYYINISFPADEAFPYGITDLELVVGLSDDFRWAPFGTGMWTDDLVGPLFGLPVDSWPVEIQKHAVTPGLYRINNPYGAPESFFAPYCELETNWVVVNVQNPARVYFGSNPNDGFTTGVDLGYGIMDVGLQAYGQFADGKITWPVKGLAIFDDDGGYYANNNGLFCIELPAE